MKKKVKILILILVILVIVISMIYSAFKPLKTDTTKLEAKMVSLSFTEQGTFVGDSVVELYPLVPGKIDKVNVKL